MESSLGYSDTLKNESILHQNLDRIIQKVLRQLNILQTITRALDFRGF